MSETSNDPIKLLQAIADRLEELPAKMAKVSSLSREMQRPRSFVDSLDRAVGRGRYRRTAGGDGDKQDVMGGIERISQGLGRIHPVAGVPAEAISIARQIHEGWQMLRRRNKQAATDQEAPPVRLQRPRALPGATETPLLTYRRSIPQGQQPLALPAPSSSENALSRWRKSMALRYHPDRGGSNEIMAAVNNAYAKLSRGGGYSFSGGKLSLSGSDRSAAQIMRDLRDEIRKLREQIEQKEPNPETGGSPVGSEMDADEKRPAAERGKSMWKPAAVRAMEGKNWAPQVSVQKVASTFRPPRSVPPAGAGGEAASGAGGWLGKAGGVLLKVLPFII